MTPIAEPTTTEQLEAILDGLTVEQTINQQTCTDNHGQGCTCLEDGAEKMKLYKTLYRSTTGAEYRFDLWRNKR